MLIKETSEQLLSVSWDDFNKKGDEKFGSKIQANRRSEFYPMEFP